VLIRALEPTHGVEVMAGRRGTSNLQALCSGPGKLAQALAITKAHNDLPVDRRPFMLLGPTGVHKTVTSRRIGITTAVEKEWRFCSAGSSFVSRKAGV
jgi:DNA-3-methyladenine glycosylase